MFRNRFFRIMVFLVIGLGLGAAINFYLTQNEMDAGVIALSPDDQPVSILKNKDTQSETQNVATVLKQPTRTSSHPVGLPKLGGAFTLVDHTGKTVTEQDYAGQFKLIFFGFTYCPAICPAELQKVNLILKNLGEHEKNITPLFITVDPERDTVEQMAQYVEQFHPRLVGLTGTPEQIDAVTSAYKVYATKVENEMMEDYMMDHSSYLYFMGPDDTLLSLYPSTDTADYIAKEIKTLLP